MSSKNLQNETNITDIFERFKSIKGFKKDVDICNYLNISTSTLANYKTRGNPPYKILFSICEQDNINFHWLMTGKGEKNFNNKAVDEIQKNAFQFAESLTNEIKDLKKRMDRIEKKCRHCE